MAAGRTRWLGRGGLLILPLVLLGLAELLARWAEPARSEPVWRDPYLRPLHSPASGEGLRDAHGNQLYANDAAMLSLAQQDGVERRWTTRERDPSVLRIFCFGASTTYGLRYAPYASYSRFLEARLEELGSARAVEVVNLGISGYDSQDLGPLSREVAEFAGDLWIVSLGHNEFKHPHLARVLATGQSPWRGWARHSALLRRVLPPARAAEEPDFLARTPVLDEAGRSRGLELYFAGVRELLANARAAGVPVLLCTPVSNVRDKEPRLTVLRELDDAQFQRHREELSAIAARWGSEATNDAETVTAEADLERVERLLEEEPGSALAHFLRGRILIAVGRLGEARHAFARSLECDGLPERAPPFLVGALREFCAGERIPLVDVERRFQHEAEFGIPGFDLFYDYCHPWLRGHWFIADEILRVLQVHAVSWGWPEEFARESPPSGNADEEMARVVASFGVDEQLLSAVARVQEAKIALGQSAQDPNRREFLVEKAVQICQAALREDPQLAEAHLVLAVAAAIRGQRGEVRARLERARLLDSAVVRQWADRVAGEPWFREVFAAVGVRAVDGEFEAEEDP